MAASNGAAAAVSSLASRSFPRALGSKENLKELVHVFRWHKAFQLCKAVPPAADISKAAKLKRFTNFSLEHVWEKYRPLQTHLLLREALLPTIAHNPEVMDSQVDKLHAVYLNVNKRDVIVGGASNDTGSKPGADGSSGGKADAGEGSGISKRVISPLEGFPH